MMFQEPAVPGEAVKLLVVAYFPVTVNACSGELEGVYRMVPAKIACKECKPMPRRRCMLAVPFEINWAVPSSAAPAQLVLNDTSQNLTCPGATAVIPDVTVAVNVTTVPDATVVMGETFNEIVVMRGGEVCASSGKQLISAIPIIIRGAKRRTVRAVAMGGSNCG
jgi:hypothetical protein